jgi:hypothetical protein
VTEPDPEVLRWAKELLGAPVTVRSLAGGANNRLFRCAASDRAIVVKRYREQNFGAEVTRRQAEVAFLRHAAAGAPAAVPELLASHETLEMIAMSAIDGMPYSVGQRVGAEDLGAAIAFYRALNSDRGRIEAYPIPAREGFLSIAEHLRHVEGRLSRLRTEHLPIEVRAPAQRVLDGLKKAFDELIDDVQAATSKELLGAALDPGCRQMSPGDFGFHNAISVQTGPVFIDFEYAGKDDPAKTLADFFLQPKVPIDPVAFDTVADAFALNVPADYLKGRARVLGRVLSIKWKSIILAPLDQERFQSFQSRYQLTLLPELFNRLQLAERQTLFD